MDDVNLLPVTVIMKDEEPATALEALREEMAGPVLLIEKLAEFEVPPPGPGLKTVIATEFAAAMSAAEMEASIWVALI